MPISKDFVVTSRWPNTVLPEQTLPDFTLEEFQKYGNQVAFVDVSNGKTYTYRELIQNVEYLADGLLQSLKIKKGEIVATFVTNCPEFFLTLMAVLKLGGTLTTKSSIYHRRN